MNPSPCITENTLSESGAHYQTAQSQTAVRVAIDSEATLARLAGDRQLMIDLAKLYLTEAPKLLREIDAAVSQGIARDVQRAAHSLKGYAFDFEAFTAAEAARMVEDLGARSALQKIAPAVQRLKHEIAGLLNALTDLIARETTTQ